MTFKETADSEVCERTIPGSEILDEVDAERKKPQAERQRESRKSTSPKRNAATGYDLTPKEQTVVKKVLERRLKDDPYTTVKVSKTIDGPKVTPAHADDAVGTVVLMNALGTANGRFSQLVLQQLCNISADTDSNEIEEWRLNGTLAMVQGIAPKDEAEGMLAAQMAAIHNATMSAANQLRRSQHVHTQEAASTMLNKLARTFALQMESLKSYRSNGQRITVEHVNRSAAKGAGENSGG